jgi:hypothetical protein
VPSTSGSYWGNATKTRITDFVYESYLVLIVLLATLGATKLIEAKNLGELLLNEGLFGKHGGLAVGLLFGLRRMGRDVLLDLPQLIE